MKLYVTFNHNTSPNQCKFCGEYIGLFSRALEWLIGDYHGCKMSNVYKIERVSK